MRGRACCSLLPTIQPPPGICRSTGAAGPTPSWRQTSRRCRRSPSSTYCTSRVRTIPWRRPGREIEWSLAHSTPEEGRSREQVALRQGLTYSFSVPTVAQRQGNFSGLETNTGLPITLYDPGTGQIQTLSRGPVTIRSPFPNNTIPVSRESPLAKYIYNITPLPTDITEPNIAANIKYSIGNSSIPNTQNNPTTIRVDHRLTSKDNFFAKANWSTQLSWFLGTTSLSSLYR